MCSQNSLSLDACPVIIDLGVVDGAGCLGLHFNVLHRHVKMDMVSTERAV